MSSAYVARIFLQGAFLRKVTRFSTAVADLRVVATWLLCSATRLWLVVATAASTSPPRVVRLSDLLVVPVVPTLLQSLHCSKYHVDCWQRVICGVCVHKRPLLFRRMVEK